MDLLAPKGFTGFFEWKPDVTLHPPLSPLKSGILNVKILVRLERIKSSDDESSDDIDPDAVAIISFMSLYRLS